MVVKKCAVCNKNSSQTCSLCNEVYYCSKEHQKDDWKAHKTQCAPFRVETNEKLGRHVVAKREVIMKKTPVVCGPKAASFAVCLGCHRQLNMLEHEYSCSKCKWPLCGKTCEDSFYHKDECGVYAAQNYNPCVFKNNNKQIAYAVVLPIRALLLKSLNREKFEVIENLESNLDLNIDTALYKFLRMQIIPKILKLLPNSSEGEILKICSIFDTNCFEIRDEEHLINIRALYPTLSLVSHECKVNTKHDFKGPRHEAVLTATVPIKKGALINTTYTQTLWCTLSRRAHLKRVKNFWCDCPRCIDPTELGLYSGSFYCEVCDDKQSKMVSTNPLEQDADWSCENCSYSLSSDYVEDFNATLRREICSIDRANPDGFFNFLNAYQNILHPTNWHLLEVTYALVQMLGNRQGYKLHELSDKHLESKIRFCEQLINVADVLEPGCSKFREELIDAKTLAINEKNKRIILELSLGVD